MVTGRRLGVEDGYENTLTESQSPLGLQTILKDKVATVYFKCDLNHLVSGFHL